MGSLSKPWTKLAGWLAEARDSLVSIAFPAPCRLCERPLVTASRVPICGNCLASFAPIPQPFCMCCGRWILSGLAAQSRQPLCRLCLLGTYAFARARSYAVYDDAMVRAIILLKYEAIEPLGGWFADRLSEVVRREPESLAADVVVPVPLHRDRQRERGYNQADLIARRWLGGWVCRAARSSSYAPGPARTSCASACTSAGHPFVALSPPGQAAGLTICASY